MTAGRSKGSQRQGARRSMSGGVLFLYVDAKSVEGNEAYETFSAACVLTFSSRLERLVHDIENRFHALPLRFAGVEVLDAIDTRGQDRQIIFGNIDAQRVGGIFRIEHTFFQRHLTIERKQP